MEWKLLTKRFASVGLVCLMLAVGAATGCQSVIDGLDVDGGIDTDADPASTDDLGDVDADTPDLANCTPTVPSCIGLCGPVYDACLQKNVQCGACDAGKVCDLVTHQCEIPKTTCAELNAACGIVRNTCGTRLSCPDCGTGDECDPDTKQCIGCTNVACEDLGFECGYAWLGCGSPSTLTDCGSCGDPGSTCNPYFNRCEPDCSPGTPMDLCADAHAQRNVECGIITDNCGGYVDCGGCAPGLACGAQGDPNRCQPKEKPVECIAAGRNCGTLTSACGDTVNCGNCTPPDVCNSNGVCGPPCQVKTCAELGNPACDPVDDGCGGTVRCNDCPNATEYTCLPNHTCCKKKSCSVEYAGMCGTQLDDGCGGKVDCNCAAGLCTAPTAGATGMCCVNTAMCPANACNTSVIDTCTGLPIPCNCNTNTSYCNTPAGTPGMCVPKNTCANPYGANGQNTQPCSNGPAFNDGSGALLTCNCSGGRYCINGGPPGMVATGATVGACCTDTGACNFGGVQYCNTTRTNTCTGANNVCGACANGFYCGTNNICAPLNTCATYISNPGPGQNGAVCSNSMGPNPAWPRGDGTNLACACNAGDAYCRNMSGQVPATPGATGTCCQNTAACTPGVCNPTSPPINTCTGAAITCGCPNGQFCTGPNGTCQPRANCGSLGKGGAQGNACNTLRVNFYNDGSGTMISCPCSTGNGLTNATCAGQAAAVEGVCSCTPNVCTNCGDHGKPNGCGGTLNCACTNPQVCFPASGASAACCAPKTCQNLPAGVPAGSCGGFNDGCGGGISCGCPTSNSGTGQPMPNMMCAPVGGSSPAYGTCTCVPTPCTVLGVGTHVNNGCGVPVTCGA